VVTPPPGADGSSSAASPASSLADARMTRGGRSIWTPSFAGEGLLRHAASAGSAHQEEHIPELHRLPGGREEAQDAEASYIAALSPA
jgi:hypothetical protein